MPAETIFIQIASYRDEELPKTIDACLKMAKYPDRLRFGIVNQFGEETEHCLDNYKNDSRFRIKHIPWFEARGVGVARHLCNQLYQNETFAFQIDSHMRFDQDWDEILVKEWKSYHDPFAVLSSYPPEYRYKNSQEILLSGSPTTLTISEFYQDYIPIFKAKPIAIKEDTIKYRACFTAGGFQFSRGALCREAPYIKDICFIGEEITRSIQLFTHGYHVYAPLHLVVYHLYIRSKLGVHHFWNDFMNDKKLQKDGVYQAMNDTSYQLVGRILAGKDTTYFGKKKTLKQFEAFAGINFEKKLLHPSQVQGLQPPHSKDAGWLQTTQPLRQIQINITIDTSLFEKRDDYDFWYFGLHDENEQELIRNDFNDEEWKKENIIIDHKYLLPVQPSKYIVYTHSHSLGWQTRRVFDL